MKLSLCSDVSDACMFDPHTACCQSPIYCRTAHMLQNSPIISSTPSVHSPCFNTDDSVNDLHKDQLRLFDADGNFVRHNNVDSDSNVTASVMRLANYSMYNSDGKHDFPLNKFKKGLLRENIVKTNDELPVNVSEKLTERISLGVPTNSGDNVVRSYNSCDSSELPHNLNMEDLNQAKSIAGEDENFDENHFSLEALEMDSTNDSDINNDFNYDINETDTYKELNGKVERTIKKKIENNSSDYFNAKQGSVKIFCACSENSEKLYLLSSYIYDNLCDMWVLDENNNITQEHTFKQSEYVSRSENKNIGNLLTCRRPKSVSCQTSLSDKDDRCLDLDSSDITEDEDLECCECFEAEPTMSSLYHENERSSRGFDAPNETKKQSNACTQHDGKPEKRKINDIRDDQTDEEEHLNVPSDFSHMDKEKQLNSPRYTYKMRAKHVAGSVLKVSVDVKEFHFQKNEQKRCEDEASSLFDMKKCKDYIITRPQLKGKNFENNINLLPYSSSFSSSYLLFNSPQMPALASSCTYLNSPQALGQRNNFTYVNTSQLTGLSDGNTLTSPFLLDETKGWTFPNRSCQSQTRTRPFRKKNRFQLSENTKMYKVCGIKSRSYPNFDAPSLQQHDLCVVNTKGLYGKRRGTRKRLNLSITAKKSSESTPELSFLRCLPGSEPKSSSKSVQSIFEDSENNSLNSSLSSNYDPFISSAFSVRSESPSQSSVDSSLLLGVDINSPELLSNPYLSNPFSGDGNDFDHDLAKIENDIFELQEKYSTTLPSKSNAQKPSVNLGNKSPDDAQPLVNRTSALNTSGLNELENSDFIPSPLVSSVQEQVSSHFTIQASSSQQQHMYSSNTSTIPIPAFQKNTVLQSNLSGMQQIGFQSEDGNQTTLMLGTGLSNSIITSIPTIKVIPQPTSMTVDFSKLEGILNIVGSTRPHVSTSNTSNIGINVPIQSQLSSNTNQSSIMLGTPTNTNNMPVMTGSALKCLSASVSVTQSESMDTSLSGTCTMVEHSDNQSM